MVFGIVERRGGLGTNALRYMTTSSFPFNTDIYMLMNIELSEDVIARFWAKVEKSDGCWLWTGAAYSYGYGRVSVKGVQSAAHRVSYVISNGSIPDDMQVCHTCDNRLCVRPHHLFLGTAADNAQDREKKGRGYKPVGTYSIKGTVEERFWRLVDKKSDEECWEWKGALHKGYGRFYYSKGVKIFAHRFMMQMIHGIIDTKV